MSDTEPHDLAGPFGSSDYGTSYRETVTNNHPQPLCAQSDPELWSLPGNRHYLNEGNKVAKALCGQCPALDWCRDQIDWTEPPAGVIQAGEVWPVERGFLEPHLRALVERKPDSGHKEASERRALIVRMSHSMPAGQIAEALNISPRQVTRARARARGAA